MRKLLHVVLYLAAIAAANLVSARWGPYASIVSAFALIGAVLVLRDSLHLEWRGRGLPWRMAALVAGGALLSWVLSRGAGRVALASCVAFALSEAADAAAFHALRAEPWFPRSYKSNVVGAAVDSLVFPTLAFGALLWPVVLGQFLAKTAGGAIWAWVLRQRAPLYLAGALLLLASRLEGQRLGPPKIVVQAQVGAGFYEFNDWRPVPNIGANAIMWPGRRLSILLVASRDAKKDAPWIGITAIQVKLWSK